jgi:hypothetical protein
LGQTSRRRIPAGGNTEQSRGKLVGIDRAGLGWAASVLCPISIQLSGGCDARYWQEEGSLPQSLNETRRQILRVLDIDIYHPAIYAVFFQVLVQIGIIIINDFASEDLSRCASGGGHSVVA